MRKYQQLLLIFISLVSVSVLFMYKTENNRLKYVLQVVNFFGRLDSSRLENVTKENENHQAYYSPMPVWQRIGSHFHAYSSYWNRNELIAGGEAIALVVGFEGSIVNFKCSLKYENGKSYPGKFVFLHLFKTDQYAEQTNKENITENFSVFKFFCKITRDFGSPETVVFTETKAKINHELMLRYIKRKDAKAVVPFTVCLNLVPYNDTEFKKSFITKTNLLQFFMHHHGIGVENFIVYNGDAVSMTVQEIIMKTTINVNFFPYNFPFDTKSEKTRQIIESDCLMRTVHMSKYSIVLNPNEFFFPRTKIDGTGMGTILENLQNYDTQVSRFELPQFAVCADKEKSLLMDNYMYDPEITRHKSSIYKPTVNNENLKSIRMTTSHGFIHTYINCFGGKNILHDWRNSIRKDFMQYILSVRSKLNIMF